MNTKEIITEVGKISGRNAIVLEKMQSNLIPIRIFLDFNLNTSLCSENIFEKKYINGTLEFNNVIKYQIYSLDYFPFEKSLKSSFDEVIDSEYLLKYKLQNSHKHIFLSTYDHILEIVCKDWVMKL